MNLPRLTVSGAPCLLPVSHSGSITYECLVLSGTPSCPTAARGGGWEACAVGAAAAADDGSRNGDARRPQPGGSSRRGRRGTPYPQALNWAAAEGAVPISSAQPLVDAPAGGPDSLRGLPRTTLSGQLCVSDCEPLRGREVCSVVAPPSGGAAGGGGYSAAAGRPLQECAPVVRVPPALTQCGAAAAAAAAADDGGDDGGSAASSQETGGAVAALGAYRRCVVTHGVELCLLVTVPGASVAAAGNAAGAWVRCPLVGGARAAGAGEAAAIGDAEDCGFPFRYAGLARSDCVDTTTGFPRPGTPDTTSPTAGSCSPPATLSDLITGGDDSSPYSAAGLRDRSSPLRLVTTGGQPLTLPCSNPLFPRTTGVFGAALPSMSVDYSSSPANPGSFHSGAVRPPERATRRYSLSRRPCLPVVAAPRSGAAAGFVEGVGVWGGDAGGGAVAGSGQCVMDPDTADFECAVQVRSIL